MIKEIKSLEWKIKNNKDFMNENPYAFYTFIELLYHFIHIKYPLEKDSYIYRKAHINAKLFSKIRNPKYHPSRKTVVALGLALELTLEEFELLLTSAQYALALNNEFDIVIIYCIQHHIYDLFTVNEILYEMGL
ncbi:hypothetical protein [Candidatus Stoquefichus massiliensis]|uniref:hypothetical protein n=1 Tax=Candidatus Stoquefichus massiliensis TaxID=1470350 RepID=UPI0004B4D208|nr:hypothetical protein [Candidatus Stoquefichus massiliensis]